MRHIILADKAIPESEMQTVLHEYRDIYDKVGIDCTFDIHREEMGDLPFSYYRRNSRGIDKGYINKRAKALQTRYNRRYDNLVFWTAHEHWEPEEDGIWGWNLSNEMGGYEIHQCRFDTESSRKDTRIANTLGTYYHESMHSHDSFVYRLIAKHIEDNLPISRGRWDACVVHGECGGYDYIRHNHNLDALEDISPLLKDALEKRKGQHELHISTIEELIELYRSYVNWIRKKDQPVYADCVKNMV